MKLFTLVFIISTFFSAAHAVTTAEMPAEEVCENRIEERRKQVIDGTAPQHIQIAAANKTSAELYQLKEKFIKRCVRVVESKREEARQKVDAACNVSKDSYLTQCIKPRRALNSKAMTLTADITAKVKELESIPEDNRPGAATLESEINSFSSRLALLNENSEIIKMGGMPTMDIDENFSASGPAFPGCENLKTDINDSCKESTIAYVEPDDVGAEESSVAVLTFESGNIGPRTDSVVTVPQVRETITLIREYDSRTSTSEAYTFTGSNTAYQQFVSLIGNGDDKRDDDCVFGQVCPQPPDPPVVVDPPVPTPRPPNPNPPVVNPPAPPNEGPAYGGGGDKSPGDGDSSTSGGNRDVASKTGGGELGGFNPNALTGGLGALTGVYNNNSGPVNYNFANQDTNGVSYGTSHSQRNNNINLDSFSGTPNLSTPNGNAKAANGSSNTSRGDYDQSTGTAMSSARTSAYFASGGLNPDNGANGNVDKNSFKKADSSSANKQVFSSRNEETQRVGIFSSKKSARDKAREQASRDGKKSSGPTFDPSKYEPSKAAAQRALDRAAGRLTAGQSRGGPKIWPEDISRLSDENIFNVMKKSYDTHLVDDSN